MGTTRDLERTKMFEEKSTLPRMAGETGDNMTIFAGGT